MWGALLLIALFPLVTRAAEVIPPVPARYFNDYAGVVSRPVAEELNSKLEAFEKETSNQIVVAIYPKMQSESSVQDYTVRVAQAWRVGQKGLRNGVVLFVFTENRQMFLQVGYGLEGALPDAIAKQITEFEIKPRFRANDYDGGLRAGVNAIMAATRGEYRGNGRTVAQRGVGGQSMPIIFLIFVAFFIVMILVSRRQRKRGRVYGGRGWGTWGGGWGGGTWGGGGWSGGSGGGSWGGGSGGSFSSGGGDFGGGGAGSSW